MESRTKEPLKQAPTGRKEFRPNPLAAWIAGDTGFIIAFALIWLALLFALSFISRIQYGFHRDELGFLDNARHLAWGFVEYPPFTSFLARLGLEVFGPSQIGIRFLAALAVCIIIVLTGLMTREFGGGRRAQFIAMLAVATSPILLAHASFFSYETIDYLWWVVAIFCLIRLVKSENPRWWLGVGAALGLGMMTKYTTAVLVIGLILGVFLTPLRQWLKSRWLWMGAGLAVVILLPNILWQIQHDFPSVAFLSSIHERDVRIGRTNDFFIFQFFVCNSAAAILLWTRGLFEVTFGKWGKAIRILGWIFITALMVFVVLQGRFYYLGPAYPMLIAVGAARLFSQPIPDEVRQSPLRQAIAPGILILVALFNMSVSLPIAPVGSAWYDFAHEINGELAEEIGWPELVDEVARIRDTLPEEEQARLGILTTNYGEAGAVNLYGPALGLPTAISGTNTYWTRGYGDPPPEVLIVLGMQKDHAESLFSECVVAGHTPNPLNIKDNEEISDHPDIQLCRRPRYPWPELWKMMRWYG